MPKPLELFRKGFGTIVEGPTGLMMPETLARSIETAGKKLPKDFTYRRIAKAADVSLPEGERTDISFITTDAVDRESEVVLPGGGDVSQYNKVVTFAHKYDQLPAGSNWWIRPGMKGKLNGLTAKTHYPSKPADWGDAPWLPSACLHMMQQPVPTCTGKSIGFLPTNIRQATAAEVKSRPELANKPIIDKWMLLEYAVAPVPCNGTAEMVTVARAIKGLDPKLMELFVKSFGIDLKDMEDGDGLAMHTMTCPMGHGPAQLALHEGGAIYCKKCMKEYDATDMQNGEADPEEEEDPDNEDEQQEKRINDALAAPFYTEDEYKRRVTARQQDMLKDAKRQTQQCIFDAIALASGKV